MMLTLQYDFQSSRDYKQTMSGCSEMNFITNRKFQGLKFSCGPAMRCFYPECDTNSGFDLFIMRSARYSGQRIM